MSNIKRIIRKYTLLNYILPFVKLKILDKYSLRAFLHFLRNKRIKFLDVGCGNNSPKLIKTALPLCHYTGIDIENYNQISNEFADIYILSESANFANLINSLKDKYDVILSSHNIEHCENRNDVLKGIVNCLKKGGYLYMKFPCEESINFPSRMGTLNYFDDSTHRDNPPNFLSIKEYFQNNKCQIVFAKKNYKPFFYWLVGFIQENIFFRRDKVNYYTWCYYGFENIICVKKM